MDYEILRLIWWALLGILLIGFAVMDGFDLGTAALLPFVGKTDVERRVVINTVGPVWEGNQVWFILGGGAIFAAWPALYAASFSGFYLAMFLVLATLILRPAGFKFRSKIGDPRWRAFWDWALFAGGVVPALVFGVAFGNLFQGVPFGFDSDLRFHSQITLILLLNPFALVVGLVSLSMIVLHGAAWLNYKTEDAVQARARAVIPYAAASFVMLFAIKQAYGCRIWTAFVLSARWRMTALQSHAQVRDYRNRPVDKGVKPYLLLSWPWVVPAWLSFTAPPSAPRFPVFDDGACGHHRHRGICAFSLPVAVLVRTRCQPDRVGCTPRKQADRWRSCWARL